MPYKLSARDAKVKARLESWTVQQFGQSGDYSAFDGATACTHVCIQKLAWIWFGRKVSIDYISSKAGYYRERNSAGQPRGMTVSESANAISGLGLPYSVRYGMSFDDLLERVDAGPILYAVRYGSEPDWRGYRYAGVTADGKPNGYARKAGRTQLTGFENGSHMVLFGFRSRYYNAAGEGVRTDIFRHDPNHGSPSRPERPPYDIISPSQGQTEYLDYQRRLGRTLYAWVPTKSLGT
jgi:hypothetical protein